MVKISENELKEILDKHKIWIDSSGEDGDLADLSGANLSGADLRWANLSGADLITASDYLTSHFERCDDGYIAYKSFGLHYATPKKWDVKSGSIIQETINANRTDSCGSGINVATKDWLKKNNPNAKKAWKVLIKWEWLADVIVPYNTDGKIRCGKVMLLDEVEI